MKYTRHKTEQSDVSVFELSGAEITVVYLFIKIINCVFEAMK